MIEEAEEITEEESHRTGFFYFVEALRILSLDADRQCEAMGNFNTPWEICDDIYGGKYIDHPTIGLSKEHNKAIASLLSGLEKLPEDAIVSPGLDMESHAGCIQAMRHPAWEPMRQEASRLIEILEPVIRKNHEYFPQ